MHFPTSRSARIKKISIETHLKIQFYIEKHVSQLLKLQIYLSAQVSLSPNRQVYHLERFCILLDHFGTLKLLLCFHHFWSKKGHILDSPSRLLTGVT